MNIPTQPSNVNDSLPKKQVSVSKIGGYSRSMLIRCCLCVHNFIDIVDFQQQCLPIGSSLLESIMAAATSTLLEQQKQLIPGLFLKIDKIFKGQDVIIIN